MTSRDRRAISGRVEERPRRADSRAEWIGASLLLALGTIGYALFVIRDFSGPLIGGDDYDGAFRGDANYFEFLGYYVRDHWHFGLRPIAFFTTDVAFPKGTHIGLLSWCAERDLYHAMMLKLIGPGPWIQTYLTAGATIGAVGVAAILRPHFGVLKAALVGFAASFMSFYAWYKYPYHLNMAALHWVTMSIAADAVTMRLAWKGKRLGATFLVLRAALILLGIVTLYCVWSLLGTRDKRILRRFALILPESPLAEIKANRGAFAGAAGLLLFGLVFYLPFVLEVVRDTAAYPMTDAAGNFWASQLHALFPYLPGVHPSSGLVHSIFGTDEGIGEYAPGFTLLIAAGVGIWLAHKRDMSVVVKPLLVTAILVFAFHPRWCKTLQIFPWFAYYRVAGRGTVVLPVLLALIGISMDDWPRLPKRLVVGFAIAEYSTALFLVNQFRPAHLDAAQMEYFAAIAKTPGQGILDWPFCIADAHSSASTVIRKELCPYYERTATAYAYRRFHTKSTVSIYLSRVHPTQFKDWLDAGWKDMFMPDDPKREHPKKELRCFSDEQWARFDGLYRTSDFAGIQLYADLLPDDCVERFHERYGAPVATSRFPRFGRVEFIPRHP
jgi:hypothetical protein